MVETKSKTQRSAQHNTVLWNPIPFVSPFIKLGEEALVVVKKHQSTIRINVAVYIYSAKFQKIEIETLKENKTLNTAYNNDKSERAYQLSIKSWIWH